MLVVLYPVFVHCYLDLIFKGHSEEGNFMSNINFTFTEVLYLNLLFLAYQINNFPYVLLLNI